MIRVLTHVLGLLVALVALPAVPVEAGRYDVVETIYTSPSVLALPTTYVAPTVYTPTSVLRTTGYYLAPTAYVVPSYTETTYVVPRRLARRGLVATSRVYETVVPTTYYLPTVTELPLISTSATVYCEPVPACVTAPVPPASAASTPRRNGGSQFNPDESTAGETPLLDNRVLPSTPRDGAAGNGAGVVKPGGGAAETPPPAAPAPEDDKLLPGNPPGEGRHEVQRPAFDNRAATRSRLVGRVISAVDNKPVRGVRVIVSDRVGRFVSKTPTTDDDGRFTVVLPDGDWSVQVPTADRKGFFDQNITASGGTITDDKDQVVPSLTFKR
jgi:hypothetical protein